MEWQGLGRTSNGLAMDQQVLASTRKQTCKDQRNVLARASKGLAMDQQGLAGTSNVLARTDKDWQGPAMDEQGLVVICIKRGQFLQLLYARLLKHTSLKPMHRHASSITQMLKPMHTATTKTARAKQHGIKSLKTHVYSSNDCSRIHHDGTGQLHKVSPSVKEVCLSHTHTQLCLACLA